MQLITSAIIQVILCLTLGTLYFRSFDLAGHFFLFFTDIFAIKTSPEVTGMLWYTFLQQPDLFRWKWCVIGAKDDGGGVVNWSYKMCKAPVKLLHQCICRKKKHHYRNTDKEKQQWIQTLTHLAHQSVKSFWEVNERKTSLSLAVPEVSFIHQSWPFIFSSSTNPPASSTTLGPSLRSLSTYNSHSSDCKF